MIVNKNSKVLFTVTEHRLLGYLIIPYIVNMGNTSYYSVFEQVLKSTVKSWGEMIDPVAEKIINLADEYNDREIFKVFSKDKNSKVFYANIKEEFIKDRIRPYIEKRLCQILEIIAKNNRKLFFKDKKYSTIHIEDEIIVNKEQAEPVFHFAKNDNETLYYLTISTGNKELNLLDKNGITLTKQPCAVIIDHQLYFIKDIDSNKLTPFFLKKHVSIPKSSEKKYFETFVLNSIKSYKVKALGFDIQSVTPVTKAILSIGENLQTEPVLFLNFLYNNRSVDFYSTQYSYVDFSSKNNSYSYEKFTRDRSWESKIIEKLKGLGLKCDSNYFILDSERIEEEDLYGYINWFNNNQEALDKAGISLHQKNSVISYFKQKIELNFNVTKKSDWFDIYAIVKFGDIEVPFSKLKKYILNGIREYELPNGEIAILPKEWFAKYKEIYQFGEINKESVRLKKYYFQVLEEKIEGIDQRYFSDLKKITNLDKAVNEPKNLHAKLRKYQNQGYKWMVNLQRNNFGGCLADDMGLGKTIQTLALLQYSKEKLHDKKAPKAKATSGDQPKLFDDSAFYDQDVASSPTSLVIMPASLLHNWENEIQKFTPVLKLYKFTGSGRTKQQIDFQYYDVILTTYGVVRNDIEILKNFPFHYIILDESQVVKNPTSKIYKAIIKLQSEQKLVLTGTPIENSLIDLWSQLNFLNRGILGGLSFFKSEFVTPIERQNNEEARSKLQSIIQPFILRRKKSDVAKDLPPVNDQVVFCDMPTAHHTYYHLEKSRIRNHILENIEKEGFKKSSITILQGLTKLRQIANHPTMVDERYKDESGKFNEITRNMDNIIAEGHKLLIFSSYIKHLEIFKGYLEDQQIKYSILTGQSTNRKKIIDDFQQNEDNKVFLISLKAGGVGLNLTAADYVFILDPWWNPASEEQAVNRAHRIGQDKKVFVYRFISSGTIEEKIQVLKEKKSNLANLFINTNNPFKDIDEEQVKELFD